MLQDQRQAPTRLAGGVLASGSVRGPENAEMQSTMEAATRIDSSGVNQAPAAPQAAPSAPAPAMDREFIIKNQIVERYLAGRLPPRGGTDFEKLIRSRPEL